MKPSPSKPDVVRFTSKIVRHASGDRARIPDDTAAKIDTLEKLEGRINSQSFRAPILRDSEGSWLRVNAAMLRGSLADYGDDVHVAVLGPEPDPVPQPDFRAELTLSPEATTSWESLTILGKRDWIRWIDDTNNPETRARRIARAIEQLSDGKRRACCVNVNGFMECRIKEDEQEGKS
ncbi:MAG: YdeI/OmpD-associated family protein [Candidatus Saccharimonas sp.]